jgi:phenylpropionate dioxygenase-like ring-hydroxylating dioxygenase large terminal subunit
MGRSDEVLRPPATKEHVSVARVPRAWYVACRSDQLGAAPVARTILGAPVVLFRDRAGVAGALLDRCPHRNVPLSRGEVDDRGWLACPYHGWRFDGEGACREVPGLIEDDAAGASGSAGGDRGVPAHPVVEQDGFVWIWADAASPPVGAPLRIPHVADPDYVVIHREYLFDCTLHAALENALDVPHTAFVHRGDFRGKAERRPVEAVRRRIPGGIEVEYVGEPPLSGPSHDDAGRPIVQAHWDRFLMPSVAQIEYRTGTERHQITTFPHTPVTDWQTRGFLVSCWRLPERDPDVVKRIEGFLDDILAQDVAILAEQTASIRRFGGEAYRSTELDLMGPEIWRMLRQAERGLDPAAADVSRRVRLTV